MICSGEVPEYAGLLYITKHGFFKSAKGAPILHKNKLQLDLQDKFYYNWKSEIQKRKKLERDLQPKTFSF